MNCIILSGFLREQKGRHKRKQYWYCSFYFNCKGNRQTLFVLGFSSSKSWLQSPIITSDRINIGNITQCYSIFVYCDMKCALILIHSLYLCNCRIVFWALRGTVILLRWWFWYVDCHRKRILGIFYWCYIMANYQNILL